MIRGNPELARAAEMYPDGHDIHIDTLSKNRCPPKRWSSRKGTRWALHSALRFFSVEDEKKSDFRDSFDHALRAFARDADPKRPNAAPRECWPSSEDFRTILTPPAGMTPRAAPASSTASPTRRSACSRRSSLPPGLAGLDQIGGITREQGRWTRRRRCSIRHRVAVTTRIRRSEPIARRGINHDGRRAAAHAKRPQPAHIMATRPEAVVHLV